MAITYIEYTDLLSRVQKFLAENHPDALKDSEHYDQIKAYVRQYIHKNGLYVEGLETDDVVDSLYSEMVEYSFLTPYMEREDVDEININAWDDVVVSYSNGRMEKIGGFFSPKHAYDIVRKMLNHCSPSSVCVKRLRQSTLTANKKGGRVYVFLLFTRSDWRWFGRIPGIMRSV